MDTSNRELVHVSNLYRNEPQGRLAAALARYCGPGRAIFCNSGAEANEGLLKLARLHGQRKSGAEGACIGIVNPQLGVQLKPLGDGFIKLVKMIIAPVIFLTIVTGIAGMRDLAAVGRVAARTLIRSASRS